MTGNSRTDSRATRAAGELGVIAFLEGSSGRAAKLLGGALVSTMANGDKGGQIRFLEFLGIGMVEVNRPTEALMFFERAIKIAESEKDSGLPFMGYEGKAQALVALGRPDEAKAVLQDPLAKARSQQKRGHEAQLLIVLGKLAAQNENKQEAIADFLVVRGDYVRFNKIAWLYLTQSSCIFDFVRYRHGGHEARDFFVLHGDLAAGRIFFKHLTTKFVSLIFMLAPGKDQRTNQRQRRKPVYVHRNIIVSSCRRGSRKDARSSTQPLRFRTRAGFVLQRGTKASDFLAKGRLSLCGMQMSIGLVSCFL